MRPGLFKITENTVPSLSNKVAGQEIKGMMSYKVVEQTRSYVVLQVKSLSVHDVKRIY